MKVLGRFLLAAGAAILVLGFGVVAAMVLGGFAVLERNAAAGKGFLVLEFIAIGVLVCVPLSIAAACWVLFRPGKRPKELAQEHSGVFLAP